MDRTSKGFAVFIILIMAISSASLLMIVKPAIAQSIPTPSVPEFTLKYVDNSYDVAPKTTSSTDPYTGKVTSTTIPGYHVQNRSVEITIKNQQFTSYLNENGSRVYLFYDIESKGHFENWTLFSSDASYWLKQKLSESYPPGFIPISDSQHTLITYALGNISDGGRVDFRVQAIIGYSTRINTTFSGIPIGLEPGETYHYYTFTGQISDWSNTQTITIPEGSVSISSSPNPTSTPTQNPTPTPSVPEFPILVILLFFVSVLLVAVCLKHRRINHE